MSSRTMVGALGVAALLVAVVAACGGQSDSGVGTDTNTNWLKHCEVDADCGELACLCNVCTRTCTANAACAESTEDLVCDPKPYSCAGSARMCRQAPPPREEELPSLCGRPRNEYFSSNDSACDDLGITCLAPSEAFSDACGCGCTSVEAYPRRCRAGCPLADECVAAPTEVESVPSLAESEQVWSAMCPLLGLAEGRCGDGKVFLFYSNGFTGEVRYYDASRTLFLGLGTFSDVLDFECGGQQYWPEPVLCDTPTVVRSICGSWAVGDTFTDLPWADGRRGDLAE
jgi:hypothetical protein